MTKNKSSDQIDTSGPSASNSVHTDEASVPSALSRLHEQNLELQLAALRRATMDIQADLLHRNNALTAEIEVLRRRVSTHENLLPAVSGIEDEVSYYKGLAEIEYKIGRHLNAFYADLIKAEREELHAQLVEADKGRKDFATHVESWNALTGLLLGTLLTDTGSLAGPIKQKRLRDVRARLEVSGLFDKEWYLECYPDVAEMGLDPIEHYLRHGARENRLPAPHFLPPKLKQINEIINRPHSLVDVLRSDKVYSAGILDAARKNAMSHISGHSVSVVIPTYNRAKTIVRSVRSALEQSVPPYEVIVADDQSTDRTLDLLKTTFGDAISEGRLVLLPCEKGGVCRMRNAALEKASGTIIAYLDSDNFWHPDHLLWAVAALESSEAQSVYTAANVHHLSEQWSRVDSTPYDRKKILAQNYIDLNCFVHYASLYKTHGGFDPWLTRLVDWDYILRLTKDAAPVRVPVVTVEYFLDQNGLANISFVNSLQENAVKVQLKHRAEMRAHGILNENAERRLDAAATAAVTVDNSISASVPAVCAVPNSADIKAPSLVHRPDLDTQASFSALPYFGGINLFVVLPNGVKPPTTLPVDFVNPRWITVEPSGQWSEYSPSGTIISSHERLPAGNFWCPDLRQHMPTAHQLATLAAASQLTMIDLAVGSFSLHLPPKIGATCLRNQVVMREMAVADFLAGRPPGEHLKGKVLRLPQGDHPNLRLYDLDAVLGRPALFGKDGQTFGFAAAPDPVGMRPQGKPTPLAHSPGRPRVLVLAQKLAVGGVERNTIEVARQLKNSHECIYLTLEKVYSEQGSLSYQAVEACANVLDLAEVGHHGIYPQLLTYLNTIYTPDILWICNGSMWLAANATRVRDIFSRCGIVDQQVYDVDAGWINRYLEDGIQSFDRFIAINRKIHEKFIGTFKMDPRRIDLIYSAINAQRFRDARAAVYDRRAQRAAFDLPQDKKLVVFMGRLVDQKRPLDFLEVAKLGADWPDLHFVLVGNGVLAPTVKAYIETHKLANVTWIKNVPDTTLFWPAVDAYVVTSEYEGLPIALIEAISLGVPVVATDVGDIRYVLEKYAAGRVVDKIGNPASFAKTLHSFLPELDKTAAALHKKGEDIIDFFSAETISSQFATSFDKAAARAKRSKS